MNCFLFSFVFILCVLTDQGLSREFLAKCVLLLCDLETVMSLSLGEMCVSAGYKLTSAFHSDIFDYKNVVS